MKAVKINMNDQKTSKAIKAVIAGVLINAFVIMVITVILSIVLNVSGNLFEDITGYLMLLPLVLGGYFGGLIAAKINGANGLLLGFISGAVTLLVTLIIGFAAFDTDITYMLLLKVLCTLLPSAIGGIKGVNKKEKFKI